MGGDWFTSCVFYGYCIEVPDNMDYREFVCKMEQLNRTYLKPVSNNKVKITGLIKSVYMETDLLSNRENDNNAKIMIGICPESDLNNMIQKAEKIKEIIIDNPRFKDLKISEKPYFYTGIDWFNIIYDISYEEYPQYENDEKKK
jgi:hypothetical protein